MVEHRDVVIVGAGPAGAATALHLARDRSRDRGRILLLEKAEHPRPKVCAGGLIPHTLACLDELGVALDVPHVTVDRARVDVPARTVEIEGAAFCTVVRRDEFDASLVGAARARGIEVREREKVTHVAREPGGIRVITGRRTYVAKVVVGADGSGSLVRRGLFGDRARRRAIARAVMADVPIESPAQWDGHARARYEFDFRAVPDGLAGYAWAFPCLIGGRPHVNAGAYTRRIRGAVDPVALVRELQARLGGPEIRHCAAPIRCFDAREPFAAPHVLLVGDAAGAEPLMGEGISFAFEYGRWAATEIATALAAGDFAFASAEARFRRSWVGKKLRRLDLAARFFYGPRARLWLGLAARWRGAQDVGLRWYNGVDDWDRRSGWAALGAAIRGSTAPPIAASHRPADSCADGSL